MKRFARWLFMKTHRAELLDCATMARKGVAGPPSTASGLRDAAWRSGIAEALETLGLLV